MPLKRGLKKVLKKGILLKRVSTTIVKSLCKIESNVTKHPLGLTVLKNDGIPGNIHFGNLSKKDFPHVTLVFEDG